MVLQDLAEVNGGAFFGADDTPSEVRPGRPARAEVGLYRCLRHTILPRHMPGSWPNMPAVKRMLQSAVATVPSPSHACLQEFKAASMYAAEAAAAVAAPASDIDQAASTTAADSVAATEPAEAGQLEAPDTEDAEPPELPANGATKSPLQKVS